MNTTIVPRFKCFSHMSDARLTVKRNSINDFFDCEDLVNTAEPIDNTLSLIFAPDPDTCVPRSDLAIMLSKSKVPELQQFIQDNLMQPVNDGSGFPDADTALETMPVRGERFREYAARLMDWVQKNS